MTIKFVACVEKTLGLGLENKIPWNLKGDLKFFKNLTLNSRVVMGRKTWDSLPSSVKPLPNRQNIVLTNNKNLFRKEDNIIFTNFKNFKKNYDTNQDYYVIGGEKIYNLFQKELVAQYVYLTVINKKIECDTFFSALSSDYQIVSVSEKLTENGLEYRFLKYKLDPTKKNSEQVYLDRLSDVLETGQERPDRTGVGTLSKFGTMMEFDISENIPALTTKRLFYITCIKELIWFWSGNTNIKELQAQKVHIWDGNSTPEYLQRSGLTHLKSGDAGPIYSFQYRHFGAEYIDCFTDYNGQGIDQLSVLIQNLKTDPFSRRHVVTAWNPKHINLGVLPPCHSFMQFYVSLDKYGNKLLDCSLYSRSKDEFLGAPFNIFSYSLLTYIIAKKVGMKPNKLVIFTGDSHIYKNHVQQVKLQLSRKKRSLPVLLLDDSIIYKDFKDMKIKDFELVGYFPRESIKAEMAS